MAVAVGPVWAQNAGTEGFTLEEIIVTAQKREENLQDVPVAVSVVEGAQLAQLNIEDFAGMSDYVPSLSVTNAANVTVISIRGVGTADNGGFEQSVGLFIDGVHQPRDRMYRATSFLDVENVQVLRGPQGYLFGKNTTGGALMVASARPGDKFEAGFSGTYTLDEGYQNGGYNVVGFLSGPLSDTFGMRLAVRQLEDHGNFKNVLDSGTIDADDEEQLAVRLSMQWQPSDSFSALLKLETGRSRIDGEPNRTFNYDTAQFLLNPAVSPAMVNALVGASPLVEGPYVQSWTEGMFDDTDSESATLTLDWDLGEHNLLSISGYSEYDFTQKRDGDLINADLFNQDDTEEFDVFSQEFRLVSPLGGKVDYVAGLYYQQQSHQSLEVRNINFAQIGVADTDTNRSFSQEGETMAIYGNMNIHFAEKWTVSLGANYTHEEKEAERVLTIGGAVPLANAVNEFAHDLSGDRSGDQVIGSAKLQYNLSDDFMLYGSVSQGFKSGGFDEVGTQGDEPGEYNPAAGPAQFEFDDEELLSYEVGGKGEFVDGRLVANWAAFYLDVTDRQFSRYTTDGFIVGNSGETNYRGVELDTQFLITENFRWDLSVAYVEGKVVEPIVAGDFTEEVGTLPGANWNFTNHLGYEVEMGNLLVKAEMYNIYEDAQEFTSANLDRDSAIRTNLRLGLGSSDDVWEVALLANNVTDEEVVIFPQFNAIFPNSAAGPNTAAAGFMFPSRSYSLQFNYNY